VAPWITDSEIRYITESFARLLAAPAEAMEYHYARLFADSPELRGLFPLGMTQVRVAMFRRLAGLMATLKAEGPAGRQAVQVELADMATRHRKYGVTEQHYMPFFAALQATAEYLDPRWDDWHATAWRAFSGFCIEAMRAAVARDAAERPAWWLGEIVQHDPRGPDIAVITIRPDPPLQYLPGQYLAVQVPRWPRVWRDYSIANATRESGLIDLHVRAVPGGMLSTALVTDSAAGDTVVLGAPTGQMTAPTSPAEADRPIVCVAGGTGLAPIKAIVEAVVGAARQGKRRPITVYVGGRQSRDLYDMRDLETLVLAYPSLTLIPVVERELDFAGRVGRLPEVAATHESYRDTDVYVAGPAGLVSATQRALAGRVLPGRLHHDPLEALRIARRPHRLDYLT
jgi:NAD(P)H-flavin reductase